MARVDFTTFQEASDFSRNISITLRRATAIHRESNIWWVNDPSNEDVNSNLATKPAERSLDKQTYLFDKSGSLVSILDANQIELPKYSLKVLSKQDVVTGRFTTGENKKSFKERLKHLQEYLGKRVIGQDDSIDSICRRLRIAYSGFSHRSGPVAVFLCIGPSGVGKTELAKALASDLMGGEQFLIRLDMSEYMEAHSVSKLIGSPPGYVGYDEEGQLTGKLRANPRSVLLLDEVEKAHPRVMDMFLQLFGEGRITDSKGETVDAGNVIVVMTSNIRIKENSRIGFATGDQRTTEIQLDSLKKFFRTELVNRIDKVVIFNRLEHDSIRKIIKPMLAEIRTNLLKLHGANLSVSDDLIEFLINEGYDPEFGVRELKRTVEHFILGGLGELMLHEELKAGNTISAYMSDAAIAFSLDKSCKAQP
ncbi:MAG: AAA family ATPase [Desulfuromonadaceae bacterium]|nr:AAA family ATPase [Desulfuromonadaceae bacterium]MDD2855270.1 AAA family ATPase [Desulfuromonadaceae bacterium]